MFYNKLRKLGHVHRIEVANLDHPKYYTQLRNGNSAVFSTRYTTKKNKTIEPVICIHFVSLEYCFDNKNIIAIIKKLSKPKKRNIPEK